MFIELHAHSAFSFLDATPLPEDIAAEAARLEQPAIALVDKDGVYGAPRFYRACTRLGLTPLVGAEVTLTNGGPLPLLATNEPCAINRQDRQLLDVLTCVQHHTALDQAGRLLAVNSERFMKNGRVMERLFVDSPEAVANTGELALRLGFTLKHLGYQFPDYPLLPGQTPIGFLRALCQRGARTRYGTGPLAEKARKQIERELSLIGRLDLAGYFLIVWDLVQYCRRNDIL